MKNPSRFNFLLLPGIFTSSHGYREMFRLLSGSLIRRFFIGIIIFISAAFINMAILMSGEDGLYFILALGFIIKDASLLIGMLIVSLSHFSRCRRNYTALEDLAITPVPRELIPGLIQRSLLRKAFYLLIVSVALEAIFAISIGLFSMQREMGLFPIVVGLYLFCSIPLIWFHYHTIYLVVSHFSSLAVRSADAMRTILGAITLLIVETLVIFFVGVVTTLFWIWVWGMIAEEFEWFETLMENIFWDESVILLFIIPAIFLPGLLICGILKSLCSRLLQGKFVKRLTNHIYGEDE